MNRSTPESRQRNMDCISTRGRILPGTKKVWAQARKSYGSYGGRTSGYTDRDQRETAGGFRNYGQIMDIGTNEAIYPGAAGENRKRADAVGLYEALGHELPASGEACTKSESYRYLKMEKRGISCNFEACESREGDCLLGR